MTMGITKKHRFALLVARKALEDVDNERGVSRARTIAEMIKQLDR